MSATVANLARFDEIASKELDAMWLIVGAILIFFMQTGFAMYEVN